MSVKEYISIPKYYATGIFRELHKKDVFLWAQAIAFKVLVTFVPLVFMGTGLVALTIRPDQPNLLIEVLIQNFFPAYQGDELLQFLEQLQAASGTITLIGLVTLSVTGLTLFSTIRAVLANIFKEDWHEHRSVLKAYLFDFRIAIQVGVFFILSIGLTLVVQSLDSSIITALKDVGYSAGWLEEGLHGAAAWLGWLLPFVLSTVMFFQLIYLTPIPRPHVRSAWTGSFVAALLWEIAKVGFTIYATRLGGFQKTWFSALGSTFILILALVFWAYYSGIVLNIGAIATLLHERKHRQEYMDDNSDTDDGVLPVGEPTEGNRTDLSGDREDLSRAEKGDDVSASPGFKQDETIRNSAAAADHSDAPNVASEAAKPDSNAAGRDVTTDGSGPKIP